MRWAAFSRAAGQARCGVQRVRRGGHEPGTDRRVRLRRRRSLGAARDPARLPHESLLYVADGGHVPYGEERARVHPRAANTSPVSPRPGRQALVPGLQHRDRRGGGRVARTLPGIAHRRHGAGGQTGGGGDPAAAWSACWPTTGTNESAKKFAALLDRFAADVRVITSPAGGWSEQIEAGEGSPGAPARCCRAGGRAAAGRGLRHADPRLDPLPFHRRCCASWCRRPSGLVDTGAAVARRLEQLLAERGLLAVDGEGGAPVLGPAPRRNSWPGCCRRSGGEAEAVLALP